MDDDFGRLFAHLRLKADAQPAVAVLLTGKAVGGDGVGEGEEGAFVAPGFVESVKQQVELISQHRLESLAADIPFGGAIDGVAHRHVVGRDGFGYRARRAARAKEEAGHLLSRADFGKRAVLAGVKVYLSRLLMCAEFLFVHVSAGFGSP